MDSPGLKTLATLAITTALSAVAQTAIDDLDGMTAVTLEARFGWGSGGTSCTALVQTTLDGTNWIDIASFDFTAAVATKHCNLEGLLSKAITSYAPLTANTVYDGVLGDRLRCVVTSVGVFANTTLSVRASVR